MHHIGLVEDRLEAHNRPVEGKVSPEEDIVAVAAGYSLVGTLDTSVEDLDCSLVDRKVAVAEVVDILAEADMENLYQSISRLVYHIVLPYLRDC